MVWPFPGTCASRSYAHKAALVYILQFLFIGSIFTGQAGTSFPARATPAGIWQKNLLFKSNIVLEWVYTMCYNCNIDKLLSSLKDGLVLVHTPVLLAKVVVIDHGISVNLAKWVPHHEEVCEIFDLLLISDLTYTVGHNLLPQEGVVTTLLHQSKIIRTIKRIWQR